MKMKFNNSLIVIAMLFAVSVFAQSPNAFNYQAVARTLSGDILPNQNIGLRISIIEENIVGTSVYQELHLIQTSNLGLFNIVIGGGTTVFGALDEIQWGAKNHFLQIELDENGGSEYVLLGTSQLLSVPYALYAENTKPLEVGAGLTINNGVVENSGDIDPINELQILELNGSNLSITNGNSIELPMNNDGLWVKEGDFITTEHQTIISRDNNEIADSLKSDFNILSDGSKDIITLGNNDGNNFYIKKHYPEYGIPDTCLLITTDEALSRTSWVGNNYQKYGLKIYPDGGMATPNLTFGDYRFGDPNESHPVSMYYGDFHKYTTGTASDNYPDFHIDASDNHVIFRTQWGTTFYGGIILKSNGGKCFRVTIDDSGDFQKEEVTCP